MRVRVGHWVRDGCRALPYELVGSCAKIFISLPELYAVRSAIRHLYDIFFLLVTKCTLGGRSRSWVAGANVWVAGAKEWVAVACPQTS
jgi:hypothetical protein